MLIFKIHIPFSLKSFNQSFQRFPFIKFVMFYRTNLRTCLFVTTLLVDFENFVTACNQRQNGKYIHIDEWRKHSRIINSFQIKHNKNTSAKWKTACFCSTWPILRGDKLLLSRAKNNNFTARPGWVRYLPSHSLSFLYSISSCWRAAMSVFIPALHSSKNKARCIHAIWFFFIEIPWGFGKQIVGSDPESLGDIINALSLRFSKKVSINFE